MVVSNTSEVNQTSWLSLIGTSAAERRQNVAMGAAQRHEYGHKIEPVGQKISRKSDAPAGLEILQPIVSLSLNFVTIQHVVGARDIPRLG